MKLVVVCLVGDGNIEVLDLVVMMVVMFDITTMIVISNDATICSSDGDFEDDNFNFLVLFVVEVMVEIVLVIFISFMVVVIVYL